MQNPDTAEYTLQVYENGEPVTLTAPDSNAPYAFTYTVTARENMSVPLFVSEGYTIYQLEVAESEFVNAITNRFYAAGTYQLQIDLRQFTITVTRLPD